MIGSLWQLLCWVYNMRYVIWHTASCLAEGKIMAEVSLGIFPGIKREPVKCQKSTWCFKINGRNVWIYTLWDLDRNRDFILCVMQKKNSFSLEISLLGLGALSTDLVQTEINITHQKSAMHTFCMNKWNAKFKLFCFFRRREWRNLLHPVCLPRTWVVLCLTIYLMWAVAEKADWRGSRRV